eukprot:evm.model.NODE_5772_length_6624_cov_21.612923.2
MDFTNDMFIRTTQHDHKAAVQALWRQLEDAGYIYLGAYEGWYSVRDEAYYTESELVDVAAAAAAAPPKPPKQQKKPKAPKASKAEQQQA